MKALVVIPSYNSGPRLLQTVHEALTQWQPVWVVIDGSDDGSDLALAREIDCAKRFRILRMPENRGKGSAILAAARLAYDEGFTHICTLDADGQHQCADIPRMIAAAEQAPDSLVLGVPAEDSDAPGELARAHGFGNLLARLETLSALENAYCGFRVYPLKPLLASMRRSIWGRRYDFEPMAAIRLVRRGLRPLFVATAIRHFSASEGGASHYQSGRDTPLLAWMHLRLLLSLPLCLPRLMRQRRLWREPAPASQLHVGKRRGSVGSVVQ